jgi:CTP synthase (UTP-ammonia lyase)
VKRILVVGDYDPENETHMAIAAAVGHASSEVVAEWLATTDVVSDDPTVASSDGVWIASGSPYRSFDGAIEAIRVARTLGIPLLGTCGGFQHAVIEFARHVAGIAGAHHAEYRTGDPLLVVDELACSLAGQTMEVSLVAGTAARDAYGTASTTERYYCGFGLNPAHLPSLLAGGLVVSGTDAEGEPRIVELGSHPFYVATLFVPQTSSTAEHPHPLVARFVEVVRDRATAGVA